MQIRHKDKDLRCRTTSSIPIVPQQLPLHTHHVVSFAPSQGDSLALRVVKGDGWI
jgi:hypothetical protein